VEKSTTSGKISTVSGYFLAISGLIVLISGYEDDTELLLGSVAFVIVGVFLIWNGWRIKRKIRRFRQYVALISAQQITSIGGLAAATSQRPEFVRRDLQMLIDKHFFVNAVINDATNSIVIVEMTTPAMNPQENAPASPIEKPIMCNSCGASNKKIVGQVKECEYCGTFLLLDS